MSAVRRVLRANAGVSTPPQHVPPTVSPPSDVTYRGYRIEPASYYVNGTAWSPRVIVSAPTDGGWSPHAPLYSPSTVKFPTCAEADRRALDIARAWIDTAVDQQRE